MDAPVVVVLLIFWTFMLTRTRFGRHIYAVGGNAEAARRAGINVTPDPDLGLRHLLVDGGDQRPPARASYTGKVSPGSGGGNTLLYAVGRGRHRRHQPLRRQGPRHRRHHRWPGHRDDRQRAAACSTRRAYINFVVTGGVLLLAASVDAISRRRRSAAGRLGRRRTMTTAPARGHGDQPGSRPPPQPRAPLLRHVHRAGQISRAELTSLMGLNRSTIAGLVGELESLGRHRAGDARRGAPRGRRPSLGRGRPRRPRARTSSRSTSASTGCRWPGSASGGTRAAAGPGARRAAWRGLAGRRRRWPP